MPSIQIDDQKLFYSWSGAGDGPVLLFIHGLGSSHAFFEPIIPSLVAKGISCLSFDTPGRAATLLQIHH